MIKKLFKMVAVAAVCLMASSTLYAQPRLISGTVLDNTGLPVIGAAVLVSGTTNGTITDVDGKFTLSVAKGTSIEVSALGFLTNQFVTTEAVVYDITLKDDPVMLDEAVVVGYGVQKKRDITGSVASVDSKSIMATTPVNVTQALQGKAAGVMVISTGDVGSTPQVRIRGNRSIGASNTPLYVVDGIPVTDGYNDINPSDVESMEVLKDASATAIYGARGANGVILITTKKGTNRGGRYNISYNGYITAGIVVDEIKSMKAGDFAEYVREAYRNSVNSANKYMSDTPSWEEDLKIPWLTGTDYMQESLAMGYVGGTWNPDNVRSYDWQGNGRNNMSTTQDHSISITGGNDKTKIYVSGGYNHNGGIQIDNYSNRYNMRASIDQVVNKIITAGVQTTFSFTETHPGPGIYGGSISLNPLDNCYNADGSYVKHPGGDPLLYNPWLGYETSDALNKNGRYGVDAYVQIEFIPGLTLRSSIGAQHHNIQAGSFTSANTYGADGLNSGYMSNNSRRNLINENLLTYKKDIGKHALSANLLQSSQSYVNEYQYSYGKDMPIESHIWYDLESASIFKAESEYEKWTYMSYMGRINYSFAGKYLLTATARYDGSSRLAEGNKWVVFPSLALGWRISDEPFLKDSKWVSNLKLRAGWGRTGNASVSPYSTLATLSVSRYAWDDQIQYGYRPRTLSNKSLTWETTEQTNIGLDFGFFKGRVSGSLEVYQQHTYDLLMSRSLPRVTGFGSITANVGETSNKGIELSLRTVNVDSDNFTWSTDISFSYNKEAIVSLPNGKVDDVSNSWFIGQPISTMYNYVYDGIWGTNDQAELDKFNANGHSFKPGDIRLKDLNGDYSIKAADDRQILGTAQPPYNAGMSNNIRWKNWDLYVFTYGCFGNTIVFSEGTSYAGRYNTIYFDYWTEENQNVRHPKLREGGDDPYLAVLNYYKGDFIRISDITLGYTLPKNALKAINAQSLRMYFKAGNPFVFALDKNFPGFNPERGAALGRGGSSTGGESLNVKNFTFGLNITF